MDTHRWIVRSGGGYQNTGDWLGLFCYTYCIYARAVRGCFVRSSSANARWVSCGRGRGDMGHNEIDLNYSSGRV